MRLSLTTIFFCTILSLTSKAQDSTYFMLEELKIKTLNLKNHFQAPSLKAVITPIDYTDFGVNYTNERRDEYILQKGSGYNQYSVDIESFQRKREKLNLWGNFQYKNLKTLEVNFNETLDYDYVYPYVMTDTVGGDLRDEHYTILGGLSKSFDKSTFALQASFVGKQSVRNKDPRTNNISSLFNATASYTRAFGQSSNHLLTLSALGERYFQKSKIEFKSELGRPTVFHETGLGNYNKIFADTRDNAEYEGNNYGVSVHYTPANLEGFFTSASYLKTSIDKKIKDVSFVINQVKKNNIALQIGYRKYVNPSTSLEFGANSKINQIEGIEGKFDNKDSQAGLVKLTDDKLFISDLTSFGGYGSISYKRNKTLWNLNLHAAYDISEVRYVFPQAYENINKLYVGAKIDLLQAWGNKNLLISLAYQQTNPTQADAIWTAFNDNSFRYNMLANNFNVENTSFSVIDFNTKFSMPIKRLKNLYIVLNSKYIAAYNLKQIGVTSGFVF